LDSHFAARLVNEKGRGEVEFKLIENGGTRAPDGSKPDKPLMGNERLA
jgi:hypothetical protein